jgi:hypothetical protein
MESGGSLISLFKEGAKGFLRHFMPMEIKVYSKNKKRPLSCV